MALTLAQDAELLPGYRLLEPLGRGGFGEVWKCEAPGGFFKALKVISGAEQLGGGAAFEQEQRALNHIKTIRHPFLLSMDRVELVGDDLIIIMELADKSLRRLLEEYQEAGRPGIPRNELLGYMVEAAEALDLMNLQHQLLHLDVKPDNLFLVSNHVKVADFGLVNSTSDNGQTDLAGLTPLYAAPERFRGVVAPSTDQYSLGMAYQELLTGTLPFDGQNTRQLLLQHTNQPPDVSALPEPDRPIVAKALAKEPKQRFASSMEFVQALVAGSIEAGEVVAGRAPRPGASQAHGSGLTRSFRLPGRGPRAVEQPPAAGVQGAVPSEDNPDPLNQDESSPQTPMHGYKFLDRLREGPCGEYWKARAPDGGRRLVHLVFGYPPQLPRDEQDSFRRLQALRHKGLAKSELIRDAPGRFFLVTDLPEQTLWDRFVRCRAEGLPGIPRQELLDHLHTAAQTLDEQYEDHDLFHLGLVPQCLLLATDQLRLADFGLIHLFWAPAQEPLGPLNARYAAPELFREPPNRTCDIYSLAVLFQELLTGSHPLRGQSVRGASGRRAPKLDFGPLPEADRVLLAQALDPSQQQRPQSCVALIEALKGKPSVKACPPPARAPEVPAQAPTQKAATPPSGPTLLLPSVLPVLTELVAAAAEGLQVHEQGNLRYLLYPGTRLVHKCAAAAHPELSRLKLEGFRHEWNAKMIGGDGQELFVLHVSGTSSFWQRCLGKEPGLAIEVRLRRGHPGTTLTEFTVQIQPVGCGKDEGACLLEKKGLALLASLRTYLQPYVERRHQARLSFEQPIELRPVLPGGQLGEALPGLSRDISMDGMRIWVPQPVAVSRVSVQLPQVGALGIVAALADVRNVGPAENGGCVIGVRFVDTGS